MRKTSILLIALSSICPAAHAQTAAPSVDVQQFDIDGVKLGMSDSEAVAAMTAHFHVPPSTFQRTPPITNAITHTRYTAFIAYEHDGATLTVFFQPRVPLDPIRPSAVTSVKYELPDSPANVERLKQSAFAKYGPPSSSVTALNVQWCAAPRQRVFAPCDNDKASLQLNRVKLELFDPTYEIAVKRYEQQRQSRKPDI